jgi:hypothetical protein
MPKKPMAYPVVIGLRLRPMDMERLEQLCERTHRGRGDLLRHLLALAEETGLSDLALAGGVSMPTGHK